MMFGFYGNEYEIESWDDIEFESECEDETFEDDIWWESLSQMSTAY